MEFGSRIIRANRTDVRRMTIRFRAGEKDAINYNEPVPSAKLLASNCLSDFNLPPRFIIPLSFPAIFLYRSNKFTC